MNQLKAIPIIFSLCFFFSCSKNGTSEADFDIKIGAAVSGVDAPGGLFLWGKKQGENTAFGRLITSSSYEKTLSNGTWNFYAVAWGGPGPMEGIHKCDAKTGVSLDGGESSISFNITNGNCDKQGLSPTDLESDPTNDDYLGTLSINNCDEKTSVNGLPYNSTECDASNKRGYLSSLKIVVPSFEKKQGSLQVNSADSLISGCISDGAPGSDADIQLPQSLPLGNGSRSPFYTIIRGFFENESCDSATKGSLDVKFPNGLAGKANNAQSYGVPKSGFPNYSINLQTTPAHVCRDERLSSTFASGSGTIYNPRTICTTNQLNNIGLNFGTYVTDSFKLLRNLDYKGKPLVPIGDPINGAVSSTFQGNLYGNHKKISNIFEYSADGSTSVETISEKDSIGLIREIDGNVSNLTITRSSIECETTNTNCRFVGMLAGRMYTGELKNIRVHGFVNGFDGVGGVVGAGSCGPGACQNVFFDGSLDGDISVGGLFGALNGGTLEKSAARVDVSAEQYRVGGIAGDLSGTLNQVRASGRVRGGKRVGGIAGRMQAGSSVLDSYSLASVKGGNNATPYDVGGIVGYNDQGTVERSFTAQGVVEAYDPNSPTSVGELVGGSNAATYNNNYFPDAGFFAGNALGGTEFTNYSDLYAEANFTGLDFTTTPVWNMPSEGGNYPRLAWESGKEDSVPFLKRPCTGHYGSASGVGSGTQSDPIWICNTTQFQNISADTGSYYILKKDLDFREIQGLGSPFTQNVFPQNAAVIKLDGNQHTLENAVVDVDRNGAAPEAQGFFGQINNGSKLKNLRLNNIQVHLDEAGNILNQDLFIGVLAGRIGSMPSSGNVTIDDIHIRNSEVRIWQVGDGATSAGQKVFVGGLSGENFTGTISNSRIGAHIDIDNSNFGATAGDALMAGVLTGRNERVLKTTKVFGSLTHRISTDNAGFAPKTNTYYGAGVGKNLSTGTIKEVEIDSFIESYVNTWTNGTIAGKLAGLAAYNDGVIQDSISKSIFAENPTFTTDWSDIELAGLVSFNDTNGEIERSFYTKGGGTHGIPGTPLNTPPSGTVHTNNSGIVSDLYCHADDQLNNGGFPNGCLSLNVTAPDFNFYYDTNNILSFTYDKDTNDDGMTDTDNAVGPSTSQSWDISDQYLNSNTTWFLENPSEPPRIRALEENIDSVLGPGF